MSPERAGSVRTTVDGRELTLSSLDKVLYPDTGFTKGQMLDYYSRVAATMLPYLQDRPLTMRRFPDGVDGQSFYEKHVPTHAPPWVRHVAVPSGDRGGAVEYGVICDLPTLLWAANLATIEFHVPLWRVGRRRKLPGPPDHLVFDLDPGEGATIVECCRVARLVDEQLTAQRLAGVPKTSGSKGLQVYAPLDSERTWHRARADAREIAVTLEREHPELVVSNMRKALRRGKVLVDWSQNHPAKTTVAAYSMRARPEPSVSTPVTWDEVDDCAGGGDPAVLRFGPEAVLARIDDLGDLFAGVRPR
ncbi:MAG: non-homologous end-joining DNA ligase [Acidimicrobiales bacterium]